jgi:hypothetical protein
MANGRGRRAWRVVCASQRLLTPQGQRLINWKRVCRETKSIQGRNGVESPHEDLEVTVGLWPCPGWLTSITSFSPGPVGAADRAAYWHAKRGAPKTCTQAAMFG